MTPAACSVMRSWSVMLLAAGLSACVPMPPREAAVSPAAPPATFPGALSAASPAAAPAWSDYFTDPTLRALITQALKNNRDLRVAVLNIEIARAQLQLRRADELPMVNLGATAARQVGSNGNLSSAYTVGFNVSAYELDLFGRVRTLSEAAAAQLLATAEARQAAQIALVSAVAQAHVALAADEELLALTQRTLATREDSLRLTKLKFDNGASSDLDLRQAQSLVAAARVALAQFQRQRDLDRNALALLLGEPLPADYRPPLIDTIRLADVPAGLPSEVLLRRPDVRQAEQQMAAAQANIGAARAALWPRISLTGSLGTASSHLSDLFKGGAWSFAAQVLQPIFDSGRNAANLQVAQVQRDVALAQYEKAIQAAFRDVADALASRSALEAQLTATREQVQAEQARFQLVQLRFDNGVSNSLELLDAQRSLFATQQALLQVQAAVLQSRVAVYRALGGGAELPAR